MALHGHWYLSSMKTSWFERQVRPREMSLGFEPTGCFDQLVWGFFREVFFLLLLGYLIYKSGSNQLAISLMDNDKTK